MRTTTASVSAPTSDGGNLGSASATVTRLRLGLEGSWPLALGDEVLGKGAKVAAAPRRIPDYPDSLCDHTNIMDLARVDGEQTRKIFGSLRGLARHSYQAAHELGDRHAQGDRASEPTAIAADLAVVSCAALTTVIVGAIARDVLVPVHRQ